MSSGHFDAAADEYAALMSEPWHVLRRRSALANVLRHGPIEGLWIDLGAGTGEGAQLLAADGAQVVAVDAAPAMSSALTKLAARVPRVAVSTAAQLSDLEGRAAGVTLHNVIEYADDRAGLIETAARCLRPGGLLSVLCANPLFTLYRDAIRGGAPGLLLERLSAHRTRVGMPGSRFEVFDYTVKDCIGDARQHDLAMIDHRGVRVLSDLAPGHPSQQAADWVGGMLELDEMLGAREPYRSTSRHWQLVYVKGATEEG